MKTAFLFSGQGAQYVGMGKELYANFDCAKKIFDDADRVLGFSISDICFNNETELNKTENTQPAILNNEYRCFKSAGRKGNTWLIMRAG